MVGQTVFLLMVVASLQGAPDVVAGLAAVISEMKSALLYFPPLEVCQV